MDLSVSILLRNSSRAGRKIIVAMYWIFPIGTTGNWVTPVSSVFESFRRLKSQASSISWLLSHPSWQETRLSTPITVQTWVRFRVKSMLICQCFVFLFFRSACFSDICKISTKKKEKKNQITYKLHSYLKTSKQKGEALGDSAWKQY